MASKKNSRQHKGNEKSNYHLMVVAGEPSGDQLGAQIMASLKEIGKGRIRFTGSGGPAMAREGLKSLFPIEDTSLMGLQEVVPKIPLVFKRIREMANHAIAEQPDAVLLIDAPDFTHRVAKRIARRAPEIPIIKYVVPQVWASRPGRAKKLGRFLDYQLALLPFEPPYFERYGLPTKFVGHPVIERFQNDEASGFRERHGIPSDATVLGVLPGSRGLELRYLLEPFAGAVEILAGELKGLHVVVPTVPHVEARIREVVADWKVPVTITSDAGEKYQAFKACDVALAASGTVTTELAIAGVPMVVAYRLGAISAFLIRRLMTAKFATILNLIVDEMAIPELIQEECNPKRIADELMVLIEDKDRSAEQLAKQSEGLAAMGYQRLSPADEAARTVLDLCRKTKDIRRRLPAK